MGYVPAMNTLDDMLNAAFDRLAEGAAPGRSAFSMIYAATIGADGRPRTRTVVMRQFERAPCRIWFNTDLRSPKASEIAADPRISILAYDQNAGFQIRIEGKAVLHKGDGARAAWDATAERSRVCYRQVEGPSTELERPHSTDPTDEMRSPEKADWGFENFGAVETIPTSFDVLDLGRSGHRRCRFQAAEGNWNGNWLAP